MKQTSQSGFTLVEMIVAVGLFAVIMLISVGALLSLVTANRKAQALQSVINNLNITLDGMVRSLRQGTTYVCDGNVNVPDCTQSPGGSSVSFLAANGEQIEYEYNAIDKRIERSVNGGASAPLTAPEVVIDSAAFYVIGAEPATFGDYRQPKVVMVIKGTAGNLRQSSRTTFHIQATAVQRVLDI